MDAVTIILLILGVISVLGIICFAMSWSIIRATEKGVVFFLGKPSRVVSPGTCFALWPFSTIVKYNMTPMIFKIKVPTVTTKNGKVKGYKEDGEEIERVDLDIFLVLTTFFCDDDSSLLKTAAITRGNDAPSLAPAIETFIIDVARSVFSEMPWPLSTQNRKMVLDYLLAKMIPGYKYYDLKVDDSGKFDIYSFDTSVLKKGESLKAMKRGNPLVQFGLDLKRTTVGIKDVVFCDPDLAKAITSAEKARLNGEADRIKATLLADATEKQGNAEAEVIKKKGAADAEVIKKKGLSELEVTKERNNVDLDRKWEEGKLNAIAIKESGVALANARKLMIAAIKDNPDLEFLRSLEEMAKGTSNTILYQIPGAFEDRISNILGGNKVSDIAQLLKDPALLKALKDALAKK
jgi:regulator of protease activity HflC (stomatin/prohibitin superfamily)